MRRSYGDDIAFEVVEIVANVLRFQVNLIHTGIIAHEF
jgi:hypothetical protein